MTQRTDAELLQLVQAKLFTSPTNKIDDEEVKTLLTDLVNSKVNKSEANNFQFLVDGNIDGGRPDTVFGTADTIDCGGP